MSEPTATSPWGEPAAAYVGPDSYQPQPGPEAWGQAEGGIQSRHVAFYAPRRESALRRLFRYTRATFGLVVIALGLGLALAASLGAIVWLIAQAIHHAASA